MMLLIGSVKHVMGLVKSVELSNFNSALCYNQSMNTKTLALKLVDDTAFFSTSCEERMRIVQLITELCGDDKKKIDMMEDIFGWVTGESALNESFLNAGEDQ